jgi:hypothetical protein
MTIVFRLIDRETGKALGQKQGADQVAGKAGPISANSRKAVTSPCRGAVRNKSK